MLKFNARIFLFFLLLPISGFSRQTGDDPKAGTLVDCGAEKAVLFGNSESHDGHYALGWTIRPDAASAKPVDWSTYKEDDPIAWLGTFDLPAGYGPKGSYKLFNGIVDLQGHKFTRLATEDPYFPHANHHGLSYSWSADRQGVRFALVSNDLRWYTANLWLIEIDSVGVRVTDLKGAADEAVIASLRKKAAANLKQYSTIYRAGSMEGEGKPAATPFKGETLRISFDSEIPKGIDALTYTGEVVISLPKGKVTGVANVKSE